MFWPKLRANAWPIVTALAGSVVATIGVTALVLKLTTPSGSEAG